MHMRLSVCKDISRTTHAIFAHVAYGRNSVLRHRCDMLCTYGFAGDLMGHIAV